MSVHRYFLSLLLTAIAGAIPPSAHAYQTSDIGSSIQDATEVAVKFNLYHGSLIVVRGSIGPIGNLNFLVDTGATPTVVDARIARKLHLNEMPTSIAVLGGNTHGGEAILPTLDFGPIHATNLRILTEDLSFLENAFPVHIDAMIGLDVVGRSPFEIDYTSRQINFGPLPHLSISVPLRRNGSLASIDGEVDHHAVRLLLDTGAASLILFEPERHLQPASFGDSDIKPGMIGEFDRNQTALRNLTLGGVDFAHKLVLLTHSPRQAGLDFDGLVNPATLGISAISIDLDQGVVAFSR